MIPGDWTVKLLPEVCRFRGGKAHEQFISESGQFVCVNSKFISTDGAIRKYSSENFCSAKVGDVLMVMSDLPNGRALAKAFLVDQDDLYAVNQRVCALTPYHDCPKYLFYVLSRNPYFLNFDDGVSQTHLLNRVFQKCPLPFPPTKAEQETIAEALSDADALIESLEQLLAKKRQLKQGAMQELLTGKKRLPGFSGKWEVKRLGEVGHFFKGSGVAKDESLSGSIPCVRYGEIYTRHRDYIKEFHSWISQDVAAMAAPLKHGDILFAGSGETKADIGQCVAFVDDIEAYAGGDIVILRPVNAEPLFLGYYLNTEPVRRQKASRGQGDAVVHISASALAAIHVALPSLPEQTAIAAVLSDMDAEIAALDARLAKARALKQGMMQELLTGAIRLPVDAVPALW
ncbi:MAG: restriction endonuclease subunit S [Gemmatimonadaceae bacterium]